MKMHGVSENDPLLKAITELSVGINMSNANHYITGLKSLKKILSSDSQVSSCITSLPEYRLFENYLINDFGASITSEEMQYIDTIDRCVRKGMIQQALTFVESKIAEDFFNKGILYFELTDPAIIDNEQCYCEGDVKLYLVYSLIKSNLDHVDDIIHYVFESFCRSKYNSIEITPRKASQKYDLFEKIYTAFLSPQYDADSVFELIKDYDSKATKYFEDDESESLIKLINSIFRSTAGS